MTNNSNRWGPADGWSSENRSVDSVMENFHYGLQHRRRSGALPAGSAVDAPQLIDGAGPSNSEIFLNSRVTRELRPEAAAKMSQTRQDYQKEVNDRTPSSGRTRPDLGIASAVAPKHRLVKAASVQAGNLGSLNSSSNTVNLAPDIYSPLFLTQNLQLPRDRRTANAWNRAFYEVNPYVRNAINLHATYPISKLNLKCEDKKVENFFFDMADKLDLESVVQNAALELWKLGEKVSSTSSITMADGSVKKIKDIVVGDLVMTHLGRARAVTDKFIKPTVSIKDKELEIFKLYTTGLAEPLIISGRHPVLSKNRDYFLCGNKSCNAKGMRILPGRDYCSNCGKKGFANNDMPDFIESSSINEKDIVYSPFSKVSVNQGDLLDSDLCYLIGQWLAEGCYCKAKRVSGPKLNGIKFCSYDREYIYDVLEPLLEKCFGEKPKTYVSKSSGFSSKPYANGEKKDKFDTWYEGIWKNGPKIAEFFFEHCGEYSKSKKMSQTLMELPPELQAHILGGFLDGDGCVDQHNGHVLLCTSSYSLANQMMLMLRRLGACPSVSRVKDNYRVRVPANDAYAVFKDRSRGKKNEKLVKRGWAARSTLQDNWQVMAIRTKENITDTFDEPVMYDIEVEEDHSYVANGIAIHNCFNYADFDESTGMWDHIYQHNPDFIRVKATPFDAKNPSISLSPDPELVKIITSNDPEHIRLRENIDPKIIHHVLMNEQIPLDGFNVSHLKMLNSPYDVRGTSIIVSAWKNLMWLDRIMESKLAQADGMINPLTLIKIGAPGSEGHYPRQDELEAWRQVFECHDEETEVLTRDGFKKYNEVIRLTDGIAEPTPGIEVACFNKDTGGLEYQKATHATLKQFNGKMRHFIGNKIDVKVTPNHRMFVKTKRSKCWTDYETMPASAITDTGQYKFKTLAKWVGKEQSSFDVCGRTISAETFMEFLGFVISEGCVYQDLSSSAYYVSLSQQPTSDCFVKMQGSLRTVAEVFGRKPCETTTIQCEGFSKSRPAEIWRGAVGSKELTQYLANEIGTNGNTKSHFKRIPRWALDLSPRLIGIMLEALVKGDGHERVRHKNSRTKGFSYSTVSKGLADDVYEAAYKCGFVPTLSSHVHINGCVEYIVAWSDTHYGVEPIVYNNPNAWAAKIDDVEYNGKVWCLTVPTGLFITRRNGKITIQHNSAQFDKDFKIVTHDAVNVEQKGYNGAIIDTSSDITFIIDSILTGLMVPKSILTQEGASYASASVALDVMRQRYNSFRTMMANWLEKKIFAPISEIQGFYKLDGGKKRLIVPKVEWNQMTLFDLDTYIGHITTGVQANTVSQHTLDFSLGLNRKNEETYMREEAISKAIMKREIEALGQMTLAELRALDPEEPIVVQEQAPLPGVTGPDAGSGSPPGSGFDLGMGSPPGGDLGGGLGDLGLGAPPSAGPLPGGGPESPPSPPPPGGKT